MLIVLIAWLYVALMMALAEAMHPQGHWWGALFTFVAYGVAPVSLVLYLLATPARRKARARTEATLPSTARQADDRGHAPGHPVAAEREEP
jgi:hypothetical protein